MGLVQVLHLTSVSLRPPESQYHPAGEVVCLEPATAIYHRSVPELLLAWTMFYTLHWAANLTSIITIILGTQWGLSTTQTILGSSVGQTGEREEGKCFVFARHTAIQHHIDINNICCIRQIPSEPSPLQDIREDWFCLSRTVSVEGGVGGEEGGCWWESVVLAVAGRWRVWADVCTLHQ